MSADARARLAARVAGDYAAGGHRTVFVPDLNDVAAVGNEVANVGTTSQAAQAAAEARAAEAGASAAIAVQSRAQAESAVASVTVGSTNSLAYPEVVKNLVTATDVVDVFVYDTRLDSDGGAWTERCQGASWFNETLNTATRGAKRAFPKVAILVLRNGTSATGTLSIYDALELDPVTGAPRFWMAFNSNSGGNTALIGAGGNFTSVAALNGRLWVTNNSALGGWFIEVSFPEDAVFGLTNTRHRRIGSIAQRNTDLGGSFSANWPAASTRFQSGLVSRECNHVHARVLPGASLDPVSGLPIPTVAVATAAGVSVIHPDGRVCNITSSSGYVSVNFISDSRMRMRTGGIGEEHAIPYVATKANTVDRLASYFNSGNRSLFTPGNALITVGPHMAGDAGVYFLATDEGNPSNGMIAYAAINYATGWQPGDIRLATLCDGAAGAIAASGELLTNNEFTSDLSGWTVSTPTDADDYVIWSSGAARLVSTSELVNFSQTITTVIGQTYNVEVEISAAATGGVRLQIGGTVGIIIASMTAAGTYFASFTAVSTSSLIAIHRTNSVSDISITRVSAKLAVVDRSYRNQGLNVVGTLIRAAVNTGNDIAAWSGLSSSNYLEQPYNANLDFGTGDFSIAFWHKGTSFTVGGDRAVPATTNPRINVGAAGGSIPRFVVNDGTTGNRLVDATTPFNSGVWNQCVCIRRGQTLEMWVNGIREGVSTVTTLGSLTAVGAIFRLGTNVNDASSASGAFALYRISAYAPTPAQIAKMYADERPLFDAGAKAFLGGTSNGVTALSFSETTRRLAVATGDGVSIFSGLRRVEYLDAANTPLAIANDTMRAVSMEGGVMAVATTNNAGVRRDAITGLDRMPAGPVALNTLRRMRAGGTTTDATPLSLSPRVHIGPRETVIIEARIVGRVYGASDTERLSYVRRGVYYRQDGGNVTLQGSVQTIGTDTETTAGADATLAIDTTAQTVTPQVTGVAATRIVWSAETRVQRVSEVAQYEEIA